MTTDLIEEFAIETPPFHSRRFTLAEYRQIRDSGVLNDGPRFEFLDGWIVTKMTQGTEHAAIVQIIQEWLSLHLPAGWNVRIQSAVEAAGNEPEPDIAVVREPATRYLDHHPLGDEVAETSLVKDRYKTHIYAEGGIEYYWIVNLHDRQIKAFSNPLAAGGGYRDQHIALLDESLEFVVDGVTVTLNASDILRNDK